MTKKTNDSGEELEEEEAVDSAAVDEGRGRSLEEMLGVLESERDKLRSERDEKNEAHLRACADLDNLRKRVARERTMLSAQAKRDVVSAILPTIDALDLAIKHAAEDSDVSAFLEGVKAARDSLESALAGQGVERIPVEGVYDPELHQVDAAIPSPDHQDGAIIEELRAGYRIGDLVARHASVVVAKSPPPKAEPEGAAADDEEAGQ